MENPFKGINISKNKEENTESETEKLEVTDDEQDGVNEGVIAEANSEEENIEENNDSKKEVDNKTSELQEKYDLLNNQYIRLAADFDNFRKRTEQEREALLKYGAESTLKKMLEVIDNFERGLKAIESVDDCEKVKECYNLAYKNFNDVLTKAGLETIQAEGQVFDPNFHEAVMQTPSEELEENTIVAELQKGYKLGDKVLRPSLVNVATKA